MCDEDDMWRIISAEMKYDRLRIGLFLLFCMVAFLSIWLGVKWERNRIPMIMLMVLVLSLSAVYAGERYRTIQKRDRLHVLFPVLLWRIGMAHLLYPICVLLGIYFLLFVSVLVARPLVDYALAMPSMAHMLTLTGLVLTVNAVILLHRDLRLIFPGKPMRFMIFVFWFLVYLGALLPFYVVTNFLGVFGEDTPAQDFLVRLLESPTVFVASGLLFSALSLVVFVKRKSYADS
jgi:hypothetical protein